MQKNSNNVVDTACEVVLGFSSKIKYLNDRFLITGLSQSTRINYTRKLAALCLNFNKLPENITEVELTEYLARLIKSSVGKSNSQFKHLVYGLRFYFKALNIPIKIQLPAIKKVNTLPIVLSKQECVLIFSSIKNFKHRIILMFIYSAGLRISELINLKWGDIDVNRMMIHLRLCKGLKDRYVPLSEFLLSELIYFMPTAKRGSYIFSGCSISGKISSSVIRNFLKAAVIRSGISKVGVCLHTLRHSYATHLLEDGLDIISIKELLGHSHIESTLLYLHVASIEKSIKHSPLDALYRKYSECELKDIREKFSSYDFLRNKTQRINTRQMQLFTSENN